MDQGRPKSRDQSPVRSFRSHVIGTVHASPTLARRHGHPRRNTTRRGGLWSDAHHVARRDAGHRAQGRPVRDVDAAGLPRRAPARTRCHRCERARIGRENRRANAGDQAYRRPLCPSCRIARPSRPMTGDLNMLSNRALNPTMDPEEWRLRCELTDFYHLVDFLGWTEMIFNHISVRLPGKAHHYLVNPFGLNYSEITPEY